MEHQRATRANTLQLLGPIDPNRVQLLKEALPSIALTVVVSVVDSGSIEKALSFSTVADALLLDSKVTHRQGGGTGLTHDWSISRQIVEASPLPVWACWWAHYRQRRRSDSDRQGPSESMSARVFDLTNLWTSRY